MQSATIVTFALGMILAGCAALYYQHTGLPKKGEVVLIVLGVALVAGGIAMLRDGLEGSRKFLWMLPSAHGEAGSLVNTARLHAPEP
jgi:hypothetical protein